MAYQIFWTDGQRIAGYQTALCHITALRIVGAVFVVSIKNLIVITELNFFAQKVTIRIKRNAQ
jgi:hypothetical protein